MPTTGLTDAVSTGLATLAVLLAGALALLALLALASMFSAGARRVLTGVRETVSGGELWAAWAVALVSMLGSLYFSEVTNFVPCKLCWLQRIAMYPLVLILLVAALRGDVRAGVQYAFVFTVATLCGCGAGTAGSTGVAGKKLNGLKLDPATVARWIRSGGGGMPSFGDQLSDPQLRQLAAFVARSSGGPP
jgi:hypothetical protein